MAARAIRCVVCGDALDVDDQLVLALGRRRLCHCSEVCLRETVAKQRRARAVRRRWTAGSLSVVALLLAGAWTVRRHRARPPQSISYAWPQTGWEKQRGPEPIYYGPAWPPTNDDWMFAFERAK